MRRFLNIGLLMAASAAFAAAPSVYEYWVDDNYDSRKSASAQGGNVEFDVDYSAMKTGAHKLSYRMSDNSNRWGTISNTVFYVRPQASSVPTVCQYWFDEDSGTRFLVPMTADGTEFEIDYASHDLPLGKHTLNYRFGDEWGHFSAPQSYEFDVAKKVYPATFDHANPADGALIDDISNVLTYWKGVSNTTTYDETKKILVKDANDSIVSQGTMELNLLNPEIFIMLFKPVVYDSGDYTVEIPEGILLNSKKEPISEPVTLHYSIPYPASEVEFIPHKENNTLELLSPDGGNIYFKKYSSSNDYPYDFTRYTGPISFEGQYGWYIEAYAEADGFQNSNLSEHRVTWMKGPEPEFTYRDNRILLKEWPYVYYSFDEKPDADNTKAATMDAVIDGIDMGDANVFYAFRKSDVYESSDTIRFDKRDRDLLPPTLAYIDGRITATHPEEGVSAVMAYITDEELAAGVQPSTFTVTLPYSVVPNADTYGTNLVAYAELAGRNPSATVTLGHAPVPEISVENFIVSITSPGEYTAMSYTLDASLLVDEWTPYTEPFKIDHSGSVTAIAYDGTLIPAKSSLDVVYLQCDAPANRGYDGRYLTLGADPEETIVYTLDGSDPMENGIELDRGGEPRGEIDIMGLNTVRAISLREGYDVSEETVFTAEYYSDETDVYLTDKKYAGEVFGWCGGNHEAETLRIHGTLNNGDLSDFGPYTYFTSQWNLRHLDLSEVTDSVVPEGALASERLLSVVMPGGMKELGADVFGNGNRTLCAIEWPADRVAPDNLLAGVENPNLLLYVNSLNYVSGLRENDVNVVSGQRSRLVRLTDGMPFFAPKEFTADDISFTREFSKRTALEGGTAGWETIVLPFEVQTVAHSKGELMPFAKKDGESVYGGLRYWLFGADVSGWVPTDKQEANVPYLIAMPNNEYYYDEYILGGEVTFSAKNAAVGMTPENIESNLGTNRFVGSLSRVESSGTVMAVNENAYEYSGEDFAPGSVFVAGLRDVRPFEAYLEAASGSKQAYMRIFDTSDVGELFAETGMRVWTENGEVCISSGLSRKVMVCDMMGRVVRMAEVSAGEVCRVQGLAPGIYIVGDVKIRL